VHLVTERYDDGPPLATWPVPVLDNDTPDALAARVLRVEHIIFPRIIDALAATLGNDSSAR
jgi:phosphoribosylglycinamide formyltransferase-1